MQKITAFETSDPAHGLVIAANRDRFAKKSYRSLSTFTEYEYSTLYSPCSRLTVHRCWPVGSTLTYVQIECDPINRTQHKLIKRCRNKKTRLPLRRAAVAAWRESEACHIGVRQEVSINARIERYSERVVILTSFQIFEGDPKTLIHRICDTAVRSYAAVSMGFRGALPTAQATAHEEQLVQPPPVASAVPQPGPQPSLTVSANFRICAAAS